MKAVVLPPVIQMALERIQGLVDDPLSFPTLTCSRPGKPRLMRSERRKNMLAVLQVLIKGMDLISGRIIRPMGENGVVFADYSLDWLARRSGVSHRTLCRVLEDLCSVKWLEREPQRRGAGPEPGLLTVSTVSRRLTKRLFAALGLSNLFKRNRAYMRGKKPVMRILSLTRTIPLGVQSHLRKKVSFRPKSVEDQKRELAIWCKLNGEPGP